MITIIGLQGMPLVRQGDNLSQLIVDAAEKQKIALQNGDILIITQKIVSKAEGRICALTDIVPSDFALRIAEGTGRDPRHVEIILRESSKAVKMKDHHLIMETRHGFVCANAAVDRSNVEGEDEVSLLPVDPDASAERIRRGIGERLGVDIAVIISDTWGRAWRCGQVNSVIGVSGMRPFKD